MSNPQITNLSDDELDEVSGGATESELLDVNQSYTQAQEQANENRTV